MRWTPSFAIFSFVLVATAASAAAPDTTGADDPDVAACVGDDPSIAIPACTALIDAGNEPDDTVRDLHSLRGYAYFHDGDYAKAISDFTAALVGQSDKNIESADLSLRAAAYAFAADYPNAIADYTESIRLDPEAGSYNGRGYVFLKMKNYSLAIADYDIALMKKPDSPQSLYGRGLAKRALGDTAGAEEDMANARKLQADVADAFVQQGVDIKP